MYKILVADDEAAMLRGIELSLSERDQYEVFTASTKTEALDILASNEIDLVVSDLMMPHKEDGLAVMEVAKEQWYRPSIIAMSAFETVENAVLTMQAGADDFLSKGFGVDELLFRIDNLLKKKSHIDQLANENLLLKEAIQKQFSDYQIVGKSTAMKQVLQRVNKIAQDAQASCLLEGESGVGKDLIARIIHLSGQRKDGPFVPVNCAAIPPNLIESELFGHEKGAFTGAISTRPGRFELAKGGIIFLDEIGELPLPLQVNLLSVLESRSFYRVGGKKPINVDLMVISATNKRLRDMVDKGEFREDLFFRLNVVNIDIPPLRERREDIEPLAQFFLKKFNEQRGKSLHFTPQALKLLRHYDFPGNVRELRNIIEDAFVFSEGNKILPQNLSLQKIRSASGASVNTNTTAGSAEPDDVNVFFSLPLKEALAKFEYEYVYRLLKQNLWNRTLAAQKAGVSREWITRRVSKFKIKNV